MVSVILDIGAIFCVVYFVGVLVSSVAESAYQWRHRGSP